MKVIDKQSGQVIDVPDDKVQAGFQAGAYALPKGTRVPIQRADGDIGTVPAEGLDAELHAGASIVPQADFEQAQAQSKYGGVGGMATTAALGALHGATGGLSDAVIGAIGGEGTRQYIRQHYEANPYTTGASQIAGAVAPALVGDEAGLGGLAADAGDVAGAADAAAEAVPVAAPTFGVGDVAGMAARAVTAPARYTAQTGKLAERLVGSIVGDNSPSLLARTAQRALATAGAGAAENAIYSLGDQLSEDVLGDKDITAQKLFAAAGHGALFGAAVGGGLGALGELGGYAAQRVGTSEALQKISETQAWRALNPNKPITREVDKYVSGGHRGIGAQLLDDGVLEAGDTIDQIAPKVRQGLDAAVQEQNSLLADLQSRGAKGVDLQSLVKRIDERTPQIIKDLGETTDVAKAIDAQTKRLAMLADTSGGANHGLIPLDKLNSFRRHLDDEIHYEQALSYTKAESPKTRMLKAIRGEVEDAFTSQADREAARLSGTGLGDWEKQYKAAKLKTQRYIEANKAAQQAISAKYANQTLSLTDKMAGFTAGGMGRTAAGAAGTAVKHGVIAGLTHGAGHLALGLGASVASKYVREHGNSTVAVMLRRAKDLSAVAQVTKRFDQRMASEVEKAVRGAPYRGKPIDVGRYDQVAKRVQMAQSQIIQDRAVQTHLGTINETAPKVSGAFGATVRRATMLLADKLPKMGTYRPLADVPPASDTEKADLLRTERIIEDPLIILKDFRAGTLTRDSVDTLKKYAPALYDEIRAKLAHEMSSFKDMPYERKVQMGQLFQMDLDGTMNPQFVQAQQQIYALAWQKAAAGKAAGKAGRHPRKASLKSKMPQSMTLQSRIAQPMMSVDL